MTDRQFDEPQMPLQHPQPPRRRIELECVGSFTAQTPEGERHTIEIWTRFAPVHDRDRLRVTPGLIVLTTTDGSSVDHIARGQYRLHGNPEISLSSDDPDAP